MALQIQLRSDVEARLREKADRDRRRPIDAIVSDIVEADLDHEAQEFADAVQAVRRGFQAAREGREIAVEEWRAKMTAQHGIPFSSVPAKSNDVENGSRANSTMRLTELAEWDVADIYSRLNRRSPETAREWLNGINDTFVKITAEPSRYTLGNAPSPSQKPAVRQLSYLFDDRAFYRIVYAVFEPNSEHEIGVVRVLHVRDARRQPYMKYPSGKTKNEQ